MPRYFGTVTNKEVLTGREISEKEYKKLLKISKNLALFGNCQNLFKIFLFNFTDLMEYLISVDVPPLNMTARTSQFDELTFNINRHLSNLLASFRAYVDHIPSQLNRRFGKNSSHKESFEKKTSEIFDTFFEYRFFSKLRNYTQHREYPKYHIEYKADQSSSSPESSDGSYQFLLDPDTLLKSYDSWGPCKSDLITRNAPVNLKEELNKLASLMTHLDMFVSNFYLDDLNEATEFIKTSFKADDFLNVEYCVIEKMTNEGQKIIFTTKNLSTDVLTKHLRKVEAYQRIKSNEG
ncbi:hypothetical protein [Reichenbachiella sp.]|uniref:hypothetical protein n=1 Tax=Reichenbachiella sp. TaxID=2184521 RepID=UPI003BAF62D2